MKRLVAIAALLCLALPACTDIVDLRQPNPQPDAGVVPNDADVYPDAQPGVPDAGVPLPDASPDVPDAAQLVPYPPPDSP